MKMLRRLGLVLALLATAPAAWATIGATAVWEVQTGGTATFGGAFNPGNTSFPTDLAATVATGTAPVVTSASYNFAAGDVGHWVFVKSGTNWTPGWYKIASVAANAATLDAATGHAVLYQGASNLNTAAGCATTASPTAGTWGLDYSQKTTVGVAFTDMVIGGTTTQFTSAGNPVGKNLVGNILNVTSGTGFTLQRFEVVSTSGTTATCDRSLGTTASTGGNSSLGGCLASPGGAAGALAATGGAGQAVYIQAGTYNVSNGTANTDGNAVNSSLASVLWQGYQATRYDYGTRPVLQASANSITVATFAGTASTVENLEFRKGSATSITTCSVTGYCAIARFLKVNGFGTNGITTGGAGAQIVISCEATGGTGGAGFSASSSSGARFIACYSHANSSVGFSDTNGLTTYDRCIAAANTSGGFVTNSSAVYFDHCVAYGNTQQGFATNSSKTNGYFWGCISEGNSTYGFDVSKTFDVTANGDTLIDCAAYNNTTANLNGTPRINSNFQALSGSPFTNAAGADFTINNTASRGAAVRGMSYTLPGLSPTGKLDGGAYGVGYSGAAGGFRPRPRQASAPAVITNPKKKAA